MFMNILLTIGAFTVPIMFLVLIVAFLAVWQELEERDVKKIVGVFVDFLLFNLFLGMTMLATLVWM